MGVWPCRAREAEPKIPGPCVRGARAGDSRAPLARPRVGGLRSRRLAIRSAGASLRLADSRGGHGAFAPWPPRIVRISRLCRSANGKSTMVGIQCCRHFRAAKPRADGRRVAGCEAARHCKASGGPAPIASAPHPASLRRLRAPRAPTPASPCRSPLVGGPGRQRTAPPRLIGQPAVNSSCPTVGNVVLVHDAAGS